MIKLSDLLLEKFELPSDLQKQLENSVYSALGHILTPHFEKFRKKLHQNRELNQKSYQSIKNVISYIKKLTESGGNTKLVLSDVFVSEYYSTSSAKELVRKISVTIEKSGNDIYIESNEKKDKLFPHLVISKDYAGWDLGRLNRFWSQIHNSYEDFEKEFDGKLVSIESIYKTVSNWKLLDKPKKPKFKEPNLMFVFEKIIPETNHAYEHSFRVLNSKKEDENRYSDYFSPTTPPKIVQTVFIDGFNILKDDSYFNKTVSSFIKVSRHEGRHLLQHVGNIDKKLRGNFYGGPKKSLRHQYNPDVRGIDPGGVATSTSKDIESGDEWKRVLHPHRDVEFKTNLYDYKNEIEEFLNKNVPKTKWREGFNDVIRKVAGSMDFSSFQRKYPFSSSFVYSTVTSNFLKELYKNDREKFDQIVKELYKLIFGD